MAELISKLGIDWRLLVANTVTFFIVLWVLRRFAYGPLMRLIEQRQKTIGDSLTTADAITKEKQELDREKERVITAAKRESAEILQATRQEADRLRQELVIKAEADAAQVTVRARADLAQEKNRMLVEAKTELADLVVVAAGKVVGETMTDNRDRSLAEKAIAAMEKPQP